MFVPPISSKQWTNFHGTWCEHHATRGDTIFALFSFTIPNMAAGLLNINPPRLPVGTDNTLTARGQTSGIFGSCKWFKTSSILLPDETILKHLRIVGLSSYGRNDSWRLFPSNHLSSPSDREERPAFIDLAIIPEHAPSFYYQLESTTKVRTMRA
jgi:hypothetical protein